MYGLGLVLSESYLTLLLVRFGTEGLLKAGRTILEVCVRSFFKFGAKIQKIFGICKFFDAKKEEKWKKMGCRMLCDRMDNVRAGSNPAEWTYKRTRVFQRAHLTKRMMIIFLLRISPLRILRQ